MPNAKPPKTLDAEQQEQLLTALRNSNAPFKTKCKGIRNHLMASLMLEAGLRVGEVVQLSMAHLYFNHVPVRTLVLTSSITKNHKERTIPVSSTLATSLSDFYQYWLSAVEVPKDFFCFYVTRPDKPITTRQVENIINTAALQCLGRKINPHMLRHTFASRLMRVTNMRTVQELLGHNFITSTQIYTHPNEDDKKLAIDTMESSTEESNARAQRIEGNQH